MPSWRVLTVAVLTLAFSAVLLALGLVASIAAAILANDNFPLRSDQSLADRRHAAARRSPFRQRTLADLTRLEQVRDDDQTRPRLADRRRQAA